MLEAGSCVEAPCRPDVEEFDGVRPDVVGAVPPADDTAWPGAEERAAPPPRSAFGAPSFEAPTPVLRGCATIGDEFFPRSAVGASADLGSEVIAWMVVAWAEVPLNGVELTGCTAAPPAAASSDEFGPDVAAA